MSRILLIERGGWGAAMLCGAWALLAAAAAHADGTPRWPSDNFDNVVYFYDTEHRAGIGYLPEGVTDALTELWIEDDIYTDNHITWGLDYLPYSTGTPVIFRSWWPPVGCIAGYNAIGAVAPVFLLPTPASRVPYEIFSEPSEDPDKVSIGVEVYLADVDTSDSAAIYWVNANGYANDREITLWADYEPGNALEALGHSAAAIPDRANSSEVWAVWRENQSNVQPHIRYLGRTFHRKPSVEVSRNPSMFRLLRSLAPVASS